MRIVSLIPSATEIVFALGLGDSLVGVTHECDFPEAARSKPHLTRSLIPQGLSSAAIDRAVVLSQNDQHTLYALDADLLAQLEPDLVLTQSLCDVCAVPRADVEDAVCTMPRSARVLSLDPVSLEDVLDDISRVGDATGRGREATAFVQGLRARIAAVRDATSVLPKPRVFTAEWLDPIFRAGHWLPGVVATAGGVEGLGRPRQESVRVEWSEVRAYQPEAMFLMGCGFDAERALAEVACMTVRDGWEDLPAVRDGRVFVVDGNAYYARPGPRLVDGLELMARLLHPEALLKIEGPAPPAYRLVAGTVDRFEAYG